MLGSLIFLFPCLSIVVRSTVSVVCHFAPGFRVHLVLTTQKYDYAHCCMPVLADDITGVGRSTSNQWSNIYEHNHGDSCSNKTPKRLVEIECDRIYCLIEILGLRFLIPPNGSA